MIITNSRPNKEGKVLGCLPEDLAKAADQLTVNRLGTDQNAYMIAKDILGYFQPNRAYELTRDSSPNFKQEHIVYQPGLEFNLTPKIITKGNCDIVSPFRSIATESKENLGIPPYTCVEGVWKSKEFMKTTKANILGGMGSFILNQRCLELPIVNATDKNLAFYNSRLIIPGEKFLLESSDVLPLFLLEVGKTYVSHYLTLPDYGHGNYIECHNQPHFWMPLTSESTGFIILGKQLNDKYYFTGFKIPFGSAIYTGPYVLHADSYLIGSFLAAYALASDYSTVILKDKTSRLVTILPQYS